MRGSRSGEAVVTITEEVLECDRCKRRADYPPYELSRPCHGFHVKKFNGAGWGMVASNAVEDRPGLPSGDSFDLCPACVAEAYNFLGLVRKSA